MKKIFLTLFILALALPAGAAIEYVDFENGDDSTGDGTYGNPWKTIGKCTTTKTGGDECRVAKHTPTSLSGTLTFTNGSTSVSTSADLTGDISAGDYVGLNATDESWWRVASLTSDTITLDYQYWGPGTAVASTGYLAVYSTLLGDVDFFSSGTSVSSRLKISGGWDLTTQTQDGMTFLLNYGQSFTAGSFNSNNYLEVSDFVFLLNTSALYGYISGSTVGSLFDNIVFVNNALVPCSGSFSEGMNTYQNIIQSGGIGMGITLESKSLIVLDDIISYSAGTGSSDYGIKLNASSYFIVAKGVSVYNCYDTGLYQSLSGIDKVYFEDFLIDTTRTNDGVVLQNATNIFFNGLSIANVFDDGLVVYSTANVRIHNVTFTGIPDLEVYAYAINLTGRQAPVGNLVISKYGGVDGDDRIYAFESSTTASYIQRDTTDARSGTCLKFISKNDLYDPVFYKVGTAKVTNGASNLTLSVYMKDDATWNGSAVLYAVNKNKVVVLPTLKTMTTSYVEQSITVDSSDIATDDYVHLYVGASGTAGAVFVDDFSATQ